MYSWAEDVGYLGSPAHRGLRQVNSVQHSPFDWYWNG